MFNTSFQHAVFYDFLELFDYLPVYFCLYLKALQNVLVFLHSQSSILTYSVNHVKFVTLHLVALYCLKLSVVCKVALSQFYFNHILICTCFYNSISLLVRLCKGFHIQIGRYCTQIPVRQIHHEHQLPSSNRHCNLSIVGTPFLSQLVGMKLLCVKLL